MTWVVPLALGGFAVLLMAMFTMLQARRRHSAHIAPAAVVGPRILVHDINDDRCTGCDACVAVCPTNVLDLVANKSRVLRFEDCIQCEACMFACPTEALVMFPEGAVPPPLKVPEIDENFQTAVPGQYLIGEVAGKPLVKSAANLGRAVIEHMLANGLQAGVIGAGIGVDVAIVGSGPGGLSAALSCIQRGLSYVVLEKEQLIASTIARYPKGKLVMAEPYDSENVSLLPVFDSSKEQLIPIWKELLDRVGMQIKQGESVEEVKPSPLGGFDIRTTVAAYRAQRVVLSIGTRGKPRTLQVQGENLPKVSNLLDDPDDWQGRNVIVVGGGDSAVEAALALADAGAKVIISYRGKGFARAQPKNKQTIEQYASEGRVKAKLGSQVLQFDPDSVTLALADGTQKRYPNDGAFVLIGADPPVQWLEKMGIRFVERPHQYQLGKSDDLVRKFVPRAIECPEDAARAAAQALGGSVGPAPVRQTVRTPSGGQPQVAASGPRKWLRSATSIFRPDRAGSQMSVMTPLPTAKSEARSGKGKGKFDAPVPLSEFAKQSRGQHTGHGRRDALSAGERTRILRMLRDEGGRLADEDSQVFIGSAPPPPAYDFDFDDEPAAPPAPGQKRGEPAMRPDVPATPAVVVGLAQANSRRAKRPSAAPPQPSGRAKPPAPPPGRSKQPSAPPPVPRGAAPGRRPVPPPFGDEATRQVNDNELMAALRAAPGPGQGDMPRSQFDEPTRLGEIDPRFLDEEAKRAAAEPKFLADAPPTEIAPLRSTSFDDNEATRASNMDGIAQKERGNRPAPAPTREERTRTVDIRNDRSISDIDWDLD